jgi:peptide deformylase
VERSQKTLVRAYDENGKPFTVGGSGLLSQAFQHEIDHLNGILFTDKAKDLKEMPPAPKSL